ncbi:Cadherin domain protein [Rubripirellula lacrimiformis]|uniref:Cadherin domain protein n=2 Tax=Rubripirellula lacrimiformis TaxID=1930273 RepID=A0A517N3K8_9BACT|nr:Cadherin domain protein [Rubripirellula lacrimiformis]
MLESLEPRCLLASLSGDVFIDFDGNAVRGTSELGAADVRVYLDANENAQFDDGEPLTTTNRHGSYQFTDLDPGDYSVRIIADPGDQTAPRVYLGTGYTSTGDGGGVNPTQLFEMSEDGRVTAIGSPTTDRIHGLVRTNDGSLIGISYLTDSVYSIDPGTGQETVLAQAEQDVIGGLAYDSQTDTIYTLASVGGALQLKIVDDQTGLLGDPAPITSELLALNYGSTFFDIDVSSGSVTEVPRQTGSPFASTMDRRSDGVIFGLQGNDLKQFSFSAAGSTASTSSTLSSPIAAISFGADDQLFGVSSSSVFHTIDVATGTVNVGVPITYNSKSISGIQGFDIGPHGTHYLVDATYLYTFNPSTGVATRSPDRSFPPFSPIFTSLTAGPDGELFATLFSTDHPVAQIDPLTGRGSYLATDQASSSFASIVAGGVSGPTQGLSGFGNVSDLTFDPVRNRIVGFDNSSDQFFEFLPSGVGTVLARTDRSLDSWSLAFNGTDFVMFDNGDANKTSVITVNPDTGATSAGFQAGSRIPTEALFFATRGDAAHRVTVADIDVNIETLDFGLAQAQSVGVSTTDYPIVISELVLETSGGLDHINQLVELRGEPDGQLGSNTYFVVVNESDSNPGMIREIIDLSDQPLGQNGYLVLTQAGSPHSVHPSSAHLQGTTTGFGGLPGDLFSSSNALVPQLGGVGFEPSGYFLIQANQPPVIGDDIDEDDNGLADPDGLLADWNVLDSVSIHAAPRSVSQAYGQILLAEQELDEDPTTRTVEPGTPIVLARGSGYAARVGESVGSDADDWIVGTPISSLTDRSGEKLELYGFGTQLPESKVYLERALDHFGEANFVGGVRGTIQSNPALGDLDPTQPVPPPTPAVGVSVLADTNGNRVRDVLDFNADPDLITGPILAGLIGTPDPFSQLGVIPLTHAFPGVTLSTTGSDNQPINFEVQAQRELSPFISGTNFFYSYEGNFGWNDTRRLRVEFNNPVREVSIMAIGAPLGNQPHYGRLSAYNANDELIGTVLSNAMLGGNRQSISVSSSSDNIAYAIAYADNTIDPNAAANGRFDGFTYRQSEIAAVTDDQGGYEIKGLYPGQYDIVISNNASNSLLGLDPRSIEVIKYENFVVSSSARFNSAPGVEPEYSFTVSETAPVGTSIGVVAVDDPDGQPLTVSIVGDNPSGLVLDPSTGELLVGPNSVLDFETNNVITLRVQVDDGLVTAEATVIVNLTDANEAPVVNSVPFVVTEGTPSGTSLGQVTAIDLDEGATQQLTYEIVGGPSQNVFTMDPQSGTVTLVDAGAIDFEVAGELRFTVRVSDNSVPPMSTEFEQLVWIADQNDPPAVATTQINVPENTASRFVGTLVANDPDANQTHTFELLGGTGRDLFLVRPNGTVEVRPGAVIDFEQGSQYTLHVRTIDSGAPPLANEATVNVSIIDVDELPELEVATATLSEGAVAGDSVITLSAVDPDGGNVQTTITMLSGRDASNFQFDPNSGLLTVAPGAVLDFETMPIQTVDFQIDSVGSDASNQVRLQIQLTDANDAPHITTNQVVISERAQSGAFAGRIRGIDPDRGDTVTFAITGGNAQDRFVIDATSGIVRVAEGASFDADVVADPLSIEVQVTDDTGASSVHVVRVVVNEVNEPPIFRYGPPAVSNVISGEFFEMHIPHDQVVDPEGREFTIAIFDQQGTLPSWLTYHSDTRTLSGYATPQTVGQQTLTLRAFEPGPLELRTDTTFDLIVSAGQQPLTNKHDRLDVDASNVVSPLDALRVINYISRYGSGASVNDPHPFAGFVDVSGDGMVTAFDALLILNGLKQESSSPVSGEQIDAVLDDRDETNDHAMAEYLLESSLF